MKKKIENFPVGTLVTWRKDESSSWLQRLREKFGEGPFEVQHAEFGTYGVPKVSLLDKTNNQILVHSENKDLFQKSWLENWTEIVGSP